MGKRKSGKRAGSTKRKARPTRRRGGLRYGTTPRGEATEAGDTTESERGSGGTMMSMRAGLQGLVGTGKTAKKKRNRVWTAISWILVLGLAGLAVYLLARRFM